MDEQNESLEVTPEEIDAAWEEEITPTETEKSEDDGKSLSSAEPDGSLVEGAKETQEQPKEETPADQPEVFTLKHMDETKQVGKDDVVMLAQKGMDYDRIRAERDQLRQYRQDADPALDLVKTYAQRNGMDVGQYIDYCRKQELMSQGINEQTAAAQVEVEKQQATLSRQNAADEAERQRQEQARQEEARRSEARRQDMSSFLAAYPDVKPDSIPHQVWERVAKGESLMSAYTRHRNTELEAQLNAERQNKKNEQRTIGSLSTTENRGGKSISDLWDSCEY